jgi:hypothetical protein
MRVIELGLAAVVIIVTMLVCSSHIQHSKIQAAQQAKIEELQLVIKNAQRIKLDKMCNNRHVINKICTRSY